MIARKAEKYRRAGHHLYFIATSLYCFPALQCGLYACEYSFEFRKAFIVELLQVRSVSAVEVHNKYNSTTVLILLILLLLCYV